MITFRPQAVGPFKKRSNLEFLVFGVTESDVDFPLRADETDCNFWTYRRCQRVLSVAELRDNRTERQWGAHD